MTNVLKAICDRSSDAKMVDENVSDQELLSILEASLSANDHGGLRPWRYKIYRGKARNVLAEAYVKHELSLNDHQKVERARQLPFRAPVVITAIASPREATKVPRRDQLFSSAAACQLITLAAWSIGLACIWRTGSYATSEIVHQQLGLHELEEIVGFVYIGKRQLANSKPRRAASIQDYIEIYE